MSARNGELQMISVERGVSFSSKGIKSGRNREHNRNGTLRRQRRRRRMLKQILVCILGIFLVAVIGICFVINWFTKITPAIGKTEIAEIEEMVKSEHYPEELLEMLEQNEETADFVKDYANREDYQGKEIDLSKDFETGSVPLLMQWDKRWGYDFYGDSMIGLAGCGPTCMTMAYLYYTEDATMNPRKMAEFAQNSGYHTQEGTSWDFWTGGAAELGLSGEMISLTEAAMQSVLDTGGLLVCSMSPGDFTTKGHFILIRGYDEDGFFVNDPNRKANSEKQWDYETLSSQIKNLWGIYKL